VSASRDARSLSGSSRVRWINSTKQFHSFLRSVVITTGNCPSLKEIAPVRHSPFRSADASELMAVMYEAVPSAVTAPPRRPDPIRPLREILLQDFTKTSAEPAYVSLQSAATAIFANGSAGWSGTAQLLQLEQHRDGSLSCNATTGTIASCDRWVGLLIVVLCLPGLKR
jgi:hypothetical protein